MYICRLALLVQKRVCFLEHIYKFHNWNVASKNVQTLQSSIFKNKNKNANNCLPITIRPLPYQLVGKESWRWLGFSRFCFKAIVSPCKFGVPKLFNEFIRAHPYLQVVLDIALFDPIEGKKTKEITTKTMVQNCINFVVAWDLSHETMSSKQPQV